MKKSAALMMLGLTMIVLKAAPASAAEPAAPAYCHRVRMVSSAGVQGVQDQTPFMVVPEWATCSDTTSADTMLSSTRVWDGKPLYRVTKERETRIDVEGPSSLAVVSMAPFHRQGLGYEMNYSISIRVDDNKPEVVWLKTTRANPLYTTQVPGWTFGLPEPVEVNLPAGKHSVYVKFATGDFDFAYTIFQKTMFTDQLQAPIPPK